MQKFIYKRKAMVFLFMKKKIYCVELGGVHCSCTVRTTKGNRYNQVITSIIIIIIIIITR